MSRRRVDLRTLPVWLQYLIALTVAAMVMAAAWLVGRDEPVPYWIKNYLVPALGWIYLLLLAIVIIDWLRKRQ